MMLLDQKNMARHLSETFFPDPLSTSFQKPKEKMNVASGSPKFISHAELRRSDVYLKNDVLFFKIVVDT